ncbi:protein let-653-like [Phymastichus coffea]|uniref:protein let-653-like n=1 Tax=Phymastichus coffea TaxID=108790 RepID=UPI00273A80A4|nr:protein let-653-like [Phymastichus coffea]
MQSTALVLVALASLLAHGLADQTEIKIIESERAPAEPSLSDSTEHAPIADASKPAGPLIEQPSNTPASDALATSTAATATSSTESTEPIAEDTTTVLVTDKSESPEPFATTTKISTTTTTTTTMTTTMTTYAATSEMTKGVETTTQTMRSTPEKVVQSAMAADKPDAGMSSGFIALVMAIAFAIAVVIVYAGLLLWRRYLEYRYGNRELLVNDLEFDTNDLRHFEL